MMVIGITGGIGSGKTTIARYFNSEFGIPVYYADEEAKKLMLTDTLRSKIIALLGEKSYQDGNLNRKYIADKVFADQSLLEKLNAIVHPAVASDFARWAAVQSSPYVLKEAAILFENNAYKNCDQVILVTAPQELRIQRVVHRDKVDAADVKSRMERQWEDEKKIPLADYVIENIDLENSKKAAQKIHANILRARINS